MKSIKLAAFIIFIAMVAIGMFFIRSSLTKAAAPLEPGRTPSLAGSPVRVYGLVEPLGREVFVGPLEAKRVIEVAVKEGQRVKKGDLLCRLDDDLERQALIIAELRIEEAVKRSQLKNEELNRKLALPTGSVPVLEVALLELEAKIEEQKVQTARVEADLRRVEIEKLSLRSPIDGIVYKIDVREGEQLAPQDYVRIVVGHEEKQVRLFVETFWLGRVETGQRFRVCEVDTLKEIGTGSVVSVSPYVGARDFRTEDRLERIDTKYAQAVLKLDGLPETPIGMQVVCERISSDEK